VRRGGSRDRLVVVPVDGRRGAAEHVRAAGLREAVPRPVDDASILALVPVMRLACTPSHAMCASSPWTSSWRLRTAAIAASRPIMAMIPCDVPV
jgi:hypothetical protein